MVLQLLNLQRRMSVATRLPPWGLAAITYAVVAVAVLSPALAPGSTVVPADIVDQFPPLSQVVPPQHVQNPLPSDASLQFYPWLRFLGQSLHRGALPEWNPYVLGGVPFTPNGYVTSYYPPYLLAGVVDPREAYTLIVLLHLFIAAMGTYALARAVGVRPLGAWFGGLAAFGALHWVHWSLHLNHSSGMVWLPAVLAATQHVVRRPSRRATAVLALVFGVWWLGGGVQYTYFGTLVVCCWLLVALVGRFLRDRAGGRRSLAAATAGLALGTALAAPVLLPTASLGESILRVREPVTSMSTTHLPLVDTLLLAVPDARGNATAGVSYRPYPYGFALDTPFVGVAAVILACAGLTRARRARLVLPVGVAIVLLLGFTGWPHGVLHAVVPGYDRFRVSSRWLSVLPAFLLPLTAIGASALLDGGVRARQTAQVAAGAVAAVVLGYAVYVVLDPASPKRFLAAVLAASLAAAAAVAVAARAAAEKRALATALLAAAVLFEVMAHTATWYPHVPKRIAYPALPITKILHARGGRIVRISAERSQLGPFPPDLPLAYDIPDAQGQAVLFPAAYDRYLRLIDDYQGYALSTNTAPPLASAALADSPLLQALDVRSALAGPEVRMPARHPRLASEGLAVFALDGLGPATLVRRAVPATPEAMWRRVADPAWNPASSAAVVGLASEVSGLGGRVVLEQQLDDRQRFRVVSARGGLLRVSGNDANGWTATIDGSPTRVYLADGTFRSVVVPAGTHDVQLVYRSVSEHRGRLLGGFALLTVALLCVPGTRLRPLRRSSRTLANGPPPS